MLVLFETPAGYALFKLLDDGKMSKPDKIWENFETLDGANKVVKLKAFQKFEDTTEAVAEAASLVQSKLGKGLKKFLKKNIVSKGVQEALALQDTGLGKVIKEKMGIDCTHDNAVSELLRGIRNQLDSLITASEGELNGMRIGLAHSLSRYKLKFSPDKVDTMIVQAIGLLDDLDKELNTYAMRLKEWYGWHFPELTKLVVDNIMYAKTIQKMGIRTNCKSTDFSDILPEEMESEVKEAAEISMGTEISTEDMDNILMLCDQVISLGEYRTQLYDYLKNRMQAIAPNLTVMVGELVGARLIAHAGSLMNLAKHPASTVQILGAEKALFRALKTKHETPKYGLIYHASLVGQAQPKHKGKISRVLAAKCALSIRVDALGEKDGPSIGFESRQRVEDRMRQLEGKQIESVSKKTTEATAAASKLTKYDGSDDTKTYNTATDSTLTQKKEKKEKKEKKKAEPEAEEKPKKKKKKEEAAEENGEVKKEKKKRKAEEGETEEPKKKKKKKAE